MKTPSPFSQDALTDAILRIGEQIDHSILEDIKIILQFQGMLGQGGIEILIRLCPGGLYGGTPAPVQNTELNHGRVDKTGHLSAQSIHLTDDIPLGKPAYRGITGKTSDGVETLCYKKGWKSRDGRGDRAPSIPAWPPPITIAS